MKSKFKLTLGAIFIICGLTNCASLKVNEEKVAPEKTITTVAKIMDAENFSNDYEVEDFFAGSARRSAYTGEEARPHVSSDDSA